MTILTRYLATRLLSGWLSALLVVGTVFAIIGLMEQLERVHGGYGIPQVIQFALLTLPNRLLALAPVIFLLGTILALAGLGRHHELTVICASGVSRSSLLKAIALPTGVLLAVLWILTELISPVLFQSAQQMKSAARNELPELLPDGGVWSRQEQRFIHLGAMGKGDQPGAISLFQFDDQGRLLLALEASSASVSEDRRWQFQQVRQKRLQDGELVTTLRREVEIDNLWSPAELPTLSLSSDSIRLSVLGEYIAYLKRNRQPYAAHAMNFWQRATLPLAVAAMVLLAIPMSAIVSTQRGPVIGIRLALGALIGVGFFMATQIIWALGQMAQLSPQLTASIPILFVLLCAGLSLLSMRW